MVGTIVLDRKYEANMAKTTASARGGGSAIAAIAPITKPDEEEMAMSLGTVFILNSLAMLLFPAIGLAFHMTQTQFGLWSALAIHDTSSVVGGQIRAAGLQIGTTVKLARALWIVPVAMVTASVSKSKTRIHWPWFILLFCAAAVANTYLPLGATVYPALSRLVATASFLAIRAGWITL
jgi:uncharacterized membrane protein YadS